ncbi:hypothetical protein [Massilia sp. CF038]|uniref:hypothetical protein n=1 Tax=Massilia sp. CF038 TaxID=1881045 RepID=UPI001161046B|nr:hypothetical protein [Massilia sp. CF038]
MRLLILPLAFLTSPFAAQAQDWRDGRPARRYERMPSEVFWEDGCRVEQRVNRRGEIMQRRTCPDEAPAPRPFDDAPSHEVDDAVAPLAAEVVPPLDTPAPAPLPVNAPVMQAPRQVTPARPVPPAAASVPARPTAAKVVALGTRSATPPRPAAPTARPPVKPASQTAAKAVAAHAPDRQSRTAARPAPAPHAITANVARPASAAPAVRPALALRAPARTTALAPIKSARVPGKPSVVPAAPRALAAIPARRAQNKLALVSKSAPPVRHADALRPAARVTPLVAHVPKPARVPVVAAMPARARPALAQTPASSAPPAPAKPARITAEPPGERMMASAPKATAVPVEQADADSANQTAVRKTGNSASEWLVVLKPDQPGQPKPSAAPKPDPMAQHTYDAYIAKKRRDPLSNL